LKKRKIPYARIGYSSDDKTCIIEDNGKSIFKSSLQTISKTFESSFSNIFKKHI